MRGVSLRKWGRMAIHKDSLPTKNTDLRRASTLARLVLGGVVLVVAGVFANACSVDEKEALRSDGPRLVLLYATCSLNKSFLSPYNNDVTYTPHLRRFAQRGVVFQRHQTEAGQSGTAFASIFSGTQAPEHGVFAHPTRLADDKLLVAEVFAAAGYETFSWLGHKMASARLNYAQGVPDKNAFDGKLTARNPAFRRILERLRSDPSYKAFIVTNLPVTHGPYSGRSVNGFCKKHPADCQKFGDPADFELHSKLYRRNSRPLSRDFDATIESLGLDENAVARLADVTEILYKSNVRFLDRLFGEVVSAISRFGLADNSVIAFTADHGEIHYRKNAYFRWTHGYQLAPEVLGVPLIIRAPGFTPKTKDYKGVSRSIDVFPTLVGLAGLPSLEGSSTGVDLSRALTRREAPPDLLAFSHTAMFHPEQWRRRSRFSQLARLFPESTPDFMWVAVRSHDLFFKLRRTEGTDWRISTYDLAADPGETNDLFDPSLAAHVEMRDRLDRYKLRLVAAADDFGDNVSNSRAVKLLRSLGYID
jgi:arylsulfatase A-like enzyme